MVASPHSYDYMVGQGRKNGRELKREVTEQAVKRVRGGGVTAPFTPACFARGSVLTVRCCAGPTPDSNVWDFHATSLLSFPQLKVAASQQHR
jgi:hypothetical protein